MDSNLEDRLLAILEANRAASGPPPSSPRPIDEDLLLETLENNRIRNNLEIAPPIGALQNLTDVALAGAGQIMNPLQQAAARGAVGMAAGVGHAVGAVPGLEGVGEALGGAGEYIQQSEYIDPTEGAQAGDRTSVGYWIDAFGEGAGQLGAQLGVGAATGGTGAIATMFASSFGRTYKELQRRGNSKTNSRLAAGAVGGVEAGLEALGLGAIAGKITSKLATTSGRRVLEAAVAEGSTEALQGMLGDLIKEHGGGVEGAFQGPAGYWEDALLGAALGGVAKAGFEVAAPQIDSKASEIPVTSESSTGENVQEAVSTEPDLAPQPPVAPEIPESSPQSADLASWVSNNPDAAQALAATKGSASDFAAAGIEGGNRKLRGSKMAQIKKLLEKPAEPETRQEFSGVPFRFTALENKGQSVNKAFRKWMMPDGLFNQQAGHIKQNLEKSIARHTKRQQHLIRNLTKALAVQGIKKRHLSDTDASILDDALKGNPDQLQKQDWYTDEIGVAINEMRAHIDSLSRDLAKMEGIEGTELGVTIEENEGTYTTRTYKKHTVKNFAHRMRDEQPEVIEQARQELLAENPDVDVEGLISYILDKDSVDAKSLTNFASQIANKADILLNRKDIPVAIRELMGENKDPFVNYVQSVQKLATLDSQWRFATDLKVAGIANGWIQPKNSPSAEVFREINISGNRALSPLDGHVTTPEMAEALNDYFQSPPDNAAYRQMMWFSSLSKWSATVGSWKSGIRNFVGNVPFALSNGDYRGAKQALSAWKDLRTTNKDTQAYMEKMSALGVIDSEVNNRLINDMIEHSMQAPDEFNTDRWWAKMMRRGQKATGDWYQSMDNFWKIVGFESNVHRYKQIHPDWTQQQLEDNAARIVRMTYPNYDRAPRLTKSLARFPFVSPFIMFSSEVARTTVNRANLAIEETRSDNPEVRKNGYRRIVEQGAGYAAVTALATASRFIAGVSDDEDEDIRKNLPPWSKNSPIIYGKKAANGHNTVIDLGHTDPFSVMTNPFRAKLRGESFLKELGGDLFGEDIFWGSVLEAISNKRFGTGGKVYDGELGIGWKVSGATTHVGKSLLPATLRDIERVYKGMAGKQGRFKDYDPVVELTSFATGVRAQSVDVRTSWKFNARELSNRIRTAATESKSKFTSRGSEDLGQLESAWKAHISQRKKLVKEAHETAWATVRLGVPLIEVRRQIAESGFAKRDIPTILAGDYPPYRLTPQSRHTISKTPEGDKRLEIIDRIGF